MDTWGRKKQEEEEESTRGHESQVPTDNIKDGAGARRHASVQQGTEQAANLVVQLSLHARVVAALYLLERHQRPVVSVGVGEFE